MCYANTIELRLAPGKKGRHRDDRVEKIKKLRKRYAD